MRPPCRGCHNEVVVSAVDDTGYWCKLCGTKNYYKENNMSKTVKEVIEFYIRPLVKSDHYHDVEQCIEELELLVQETYKKGYVDAGINPDAK